jgi:hypothetical protein
MEKLMPTFMSRSTFDTLANVWHQLSAKPIEADIGPSNIFVPWAGEQLIAKSRGIYYVGIASDSEAVDGEQSFEARLLATEDFYRHPTRGYSPFWRFLDRLTREILGGPYDQTQEWWGWSNLLKVAGTVREPQYWPAVLIETQQAACIIAFQEEIARLRDSLIVVTSGNDYGILYKAVAEESRWDKQPSESKTYWFHDRIAGNTYINCYHPKYMSTQGFFEAALTEIVRLAHETLPSF